MTRIAAKTPSDDVDGDAGALDVGRLQEHVGYALRRAQLAVFQDFIQTMEKVALRPAQYSVLLVMDTHPGLKQTEIAALLGIKRTNFVALVDELEQRGLAERAPSPTDRRSNALYLTKAGKALLARAEKTVTEHEQRLIGLIGVEGKRQLLGLLSKLAELG
ncbi:MAG: MarR family transcriptional regulator [Alphaproteobacteria bacterium]|nr:MarR family transcriptional regulator [Alphaproteobacteria bacterium]